MTDKSFDQIMEDITVGLVGDPSKDLPYLMSQIELFKDHEFATEILRACGRLIAQSLPEDDRAKFETFMGNHQNASQSVLDETRFNLMQGNVDKALELILPYAQKMYDMEKNGFYAEDQVSIYFNFEDFFEEVIWSVLNRPEKEVRSAGEPFALIYMAAASALFEKKEHEQAILWLERAIRWNPAEPHIRFELSENYKMLGDMEKAEEAADQAFPYIFTPGNLARYYRTKGFLRIESGDYELAAAYLVGSLIYEVSQMVPSELVYIKRMHDEDYTDMEPSEAAAIIKQAGQEFGPAENVLETLIGLVNIGKQENNADLTADAAMLLWNLTYDDMFKEILIDLGRWEENSTPQH